MESKKELEALPDYSTEIEADNVVKRYARRHEALKNYCLADFVSKVVSVTKVEHNDSMKIEDEETIYQFKDDANEDADEEKRFNSFDTSQKIRYLVLNGDWKISTDM